MVKNLPASQETQVRTLGWENPLEQGNSYPLQYSCLEYPWTEEPGGLQSMGSQRVGHGWATNTFTLRRGGSDGPPKEQTEERDCAGNSMGLEFPLGSTRTLLKDTRIYHVMKNSAQESSWELGGKMTPKKVRIDGVISGQSWRGINCVKGLAVESQYESIELPPNPEGNNAWSWWDPLSHAYLAP